MAPNALDIPRVPVAAMRIDSALDDAILDHYALGSGTSIIAYSAALHHLYLRGDGNPTVAMLGVSSTGKLTALETVTATEKGHCMEADETAHLWVCDWDHGRLLRFTHSNAATSE